jgi:hypothetical protein
VHGHSWAEWFAWKKGRDARTVSRREARDQRAARELDRILSGVAQEEGGGEEEAGPSTMVQVWLPVDEQEAALVLQEAEHSTSNSNSNSDSNNSSGSNTNTSSKVEVDTVGGDKVLLYPPPSVEIEVLRGSVVVHECCAEAMNTTRMHKYAAKLDAYKKAYQAQRRMLNAKAAVTHKHKHKQSSLVQERLEAALRLALTRKEGQYPEERVLADVLVGLGQGKVVSLGYDFSGHVYYARAGPSARLVCSRRRAGGGGGGGGKEPVEGAMVTMPDPLGLVLPQGGGERER